VATGVTFSGFNKVDFGGILDVMMQQASQPLVNMQNRQTALRAQMTTYDLLAARLSTIGTAAKSLGSSGELSIYKATASDPTALSVSAGAGAVPGRYDVTVQALARAQVTASATTIPDANLTVVASTGSVTIDGVVVNISGAVTLQQLAAAINNTPDIGVNAAVVRTSTDAYRLVLTGRSTGLDQAFEITSTLGSGITFTDTDGDGISGDTDTDNAVNAANARLLFNNIQVESASNSFDEVVPGVTVDVLKADPTATISIDVSADNGALKDRVMGFITAYNELMKFAKDQTKSAFAGDSASIGRDALVRQLRNQLRDAVGADYPGGTMTRLSEVGIEFTRTGTLELNETMFNAAMADRPDDVKALFGGASGAFAAVDDLIDEYSQAAGLVSAAKDRLKKQSATLDNQISSMQERLAVQRAYLQREFVAADAAMTRLNNQSGALASLGTSYL
jgi:flagellar hook-associated protein 2